MRVSLAPTWRAAGARIVLVAIGVALVGGAMYLVNGPPSPERVVRQNEIARFAPTVVHGLVQFNGETGLVLLGAWIARRWLKIKL